MRRFTMPPMKEGGVNVTPLIDIIMCMIVFFMLVAKIGIDTGADKSIVLPPSFIGSDIKDMGNTLTLNVTQGPADQSGQPQPFITALVKGQEKQLRIHADVNGTQEFELFNVLKAARDGDPSAGLPPNPDFKVIIRADEGTEYEYLQPVLAECGRAHVPYDFATIRSEAPPQ